MDPDALTALYVDDVHIFDAMGAWETQGKDAWRVIVEAWLSEPGLTPGCAFEDLTIFEEGDFAAAHASVEYSHVQNDNGKRTSLWNRGSWVLRRINEDWKIVTEHTSVLINDKTMEPIWERQR
jgi:ketosteroid isomerase-like protein